MKIDTLLINHSKQIAILLIIMGLFIIPFDGYEFSILVIGLGIAILTSKENIFDCFSDWDW